VLEDGDQVMTHFTVSGTNTGSLGSLPPTGRRVEIDGMSLIRYEDGRIAEERIFLDSREFRRQLGLSFPTVLGTLPRLAYRALRARL
jgi:predicted ester cyclase